MKAKIKKANEIHMVYQFDYICIFTENINNKKSIKQRNHLDNNLIVTMLGLYFQKLFELGL